MQICREVPNIVGWKMTYMYDGFRIVAQGLRSLDRHVAIMGALASRFHEYKATGLLRRHTERVLELCLRANA